MLLNLWVQWQSRPMGGFVVLKSGARNAARYREADRGVHPGYALPAARPEFTIFYDPFRTYRRYLQKISTDFKP